MDKLTNHLNTVVNPSWNFSGRLVTPEMHQQNALVGLASEAGELLDIGKKSWWHTAKEDGYYREKMLGEFGDVIYYVLKALDVYGIDIDEVLAYNKKKLESRHPELKCVATRFPEGFIK